MADNGDLAWLSGRVGRAEYQSRPDSTSRRRRRQGYAGAHEFSRLVDDAGAGIVCEPTKIGQAKRDVAEAGDAGPIIALIGWPTGRHHSLIKAAEARLAVEEGASEVWVAVDASGREDAARADDADAGVSAETINAVLADIIAVSQVVEEPTRFGVTFPASIGTRVVQELAEAVAKVGVDVVAVGVDKPDAIDLPSVTCRLAVHGEVESLDAAADALLAGAERVFPVRG